jgi:hypothetical protein
MKTWKGVARGARAAAARRRLGAWLSCLALAAAAGCDDGSGDSTDLVVPEDAPRIVDASIVDVGADGIDAGDVAVIRFDRDVILRSETFNAIVPDDLSESFGEGAVQQQSVPGSDTIEVLLGDGPSLAPAPGGTRINVVFGSGVVQVEGTDGTAAGPARRSTVLDDATGLPPLLVEARFVDADGDDATGAGDFLVLVFDQPILVPDGGSVTDNFGLTLPGDSFGDDPLLAAAAALAGSRAARITLGAGAVLGGLAGPPPAGAAPSAVEVLPARTISGAGAGTLIQVSVAAEIVAASATFFGNGRAADQVLLAPPGPPAAGPADVLLAGGRLFVADAANHRVLIFSPFPLTDGAVSDLVLGQADLAGTEANRGGPANASTLSAPSGLASDGTRLVVADTGNHRVLIWSALPEASGQPADVIIGQETASGVAPNAGGAASAHTLHAPVGVAIGQDTLAVADSGNHRALLFADYTALAGFDAATVVLGQEGFTEKEPDRGEGAFGPTAETLEGPEDVLIASKRLYVADTGNHRVLVWTSLPRANGSPADRVYGQRDLRSAAFGSAGGGSLIEPRGLALDSAESLLVIADSGEHRVVIHDDVRGAAPGEPQREARTVLGQRGFGIRLENGGFEEPGLATLSFPRGVVFNGAECLVADSGNARVVVYR